MSSTFLISLVRFSVFYNANRLKYNNSSLSADGNIMCKSNKIYMHIQNYVFLNAILYTNCANLFSVLSYFLLSAIHPFLINSSVRVDLELSHSVLRVIEKNVCKKK